MDGKNLGQRNSGAGDAKQDHSGDKLEKVFSPLIIAG
jgi:hypothetical protein